MEVDDIREHRSVKLGLDVSDNGRQRWLDPSPCDDNRVPKNVQEKGKQRDRGVGLGMRFRAGGTKEWPSRQGAGEDTRRT